ncbi:MAG: LysM peptidoglycan-binding domain-containing protein [Candidatus Cloacimonetes bacterium]|nr:LysM peptidoglycan-binding domain-containing protein [Candidatus Cloacimonadota bacterium]
MNKKCILFILINLWLNAFLFSNEIYTVQRGDTLTRIATRFQISVNDLREMNNLSNDNIRVGQRLVVRKFTGQTPIHYTVRAGDNLTSIARSRNTTVSQLVEWNSLRSSNIRVGQRLIVGYEAPSNTTPTQNQPAVSTSQRFHIVEPGETLTSISRHYDIDVIYLVEYNRLTGFTIYPGQRIWLEDGHVTIDVSENLPPIVQQTPTVASSNRSVTHTVRRGENLFRIALQYGVSVEDLRRWNRLSNTNIRVGQILNIMEPSNVANLNVDRNVAPLPVAAGRAILPVGHVNILSEFGVRGGMMHQGIDLGGSPGSHIFAVLPGVVAFSGVQRGFGNVVILEHANNIMTVYAHNESNLVSVGERVDQGQIIATIGNTGNANAYHVHFEYRVRGIARNPRELLRF